MSRDGNLRASDADRELAVSMLQRAAAEGRLDADELDERVQRALRAKTYAQLADTVVDLPPSGESPRPRRGSRRDSVPTWATGPRSWRVAIGTTAGAWMFRAVRRRPSLLFVLLPLFAVAAMFALCLATMWLTVMAVALLAGGRSRRIVVDCSRDWAAGSSRAWMLRAGRRTSF